MSDNGFRIGINFNGKDVRPFAEATRKEGDTKLSAKVDCNSRLNDCKVTVGGEKQLNANSKVNVSASYYRNSFDANVGGEYKDNSGVSKVAAQFGSNGINKATLERMVKNGDGSSTTGTLNVGNQTNVSIQHKKDSDVFFGSVNLKKPAVEIKATRTNNGESVTASVDSNKGLGIGVKKGTGPDALSAQTTIIKKP